MRCRSTPTPKAGLAIFGTGNRTNKILVLPVESVEEDQLLLSVGRIVEDVDVQGDLRGWFVEGIHEPPNEMLFQSQQVARSDSIFKSRQGGLTGQIVVVGQPVRDHLENGVAAQEIMIVLVFITRDDTVHATAHHL